MAETGRKIDLNACTVEDLDRFEFVDRKLAKDIIDHRNRLNGFETWEDLRKVPGVNKSTIDRLQNVARLGKD